MSTTSLRELISPSDNSTILETANARWNATTIAFGGGGSYEARLGRLRLRPAAKVDYFSLTDDAHTASGGGTAFDLSIAERRDKAVTGTYTLAAGYLLSRSDEVSSRVEVELGDRQKLSGSLSDTVASFADGQTFTLQPDALRYGPLAKLRLAIGTDGFSLLGEIGAQKSQGTVAGNASVGFRVQL